jgi:hypothetical protein
MRPVLVAAVVFGAGCGSMMMMPDGGTAGGRAGGSAGGSTAGGSAGGATAGGSAGGATAGGSAGGATAGGAAGGAMAGGSAGGATAGGAAGGATAGGSAGGATAGGAAAGGAAGGATAGGAAGGATAGGTAGGAAAGGAAFDPCLPTAYDAGVPGGALFPDGGFTPAGSVVLTDAGVTATAVSAFSGYPAENVLDFDLGSSWYIANGACVSGPVSPIECCSTQVLTVQLPAARAVSAIVIRGNRGSFADDYDFLTGRLDLLDPSGVVVESRPVVFSRPDSDWATAFSPAIANVRTMRFVPGWSENEGGLSELQVFSP